MSAWVSVMCELMRVEFNLSERTVCGFCIWVLLVWIDFLVVCWSGPVPYLFFIGEQSTNPLFREAVSGDFLVEGDFLTRVFVECNARFF